MSFYKVGAVRSLATCSVDKEGHLRNAAQDTDTKESVRSYYADGSRKIDVHAILERAASAFDISTDPKDYVFEAIRANTANIPNENQDAFHHDELLRFDRRAGMPVYMTYTEKPHHVDHKVDNPKTARGVILDAHYNDDAPALPSCPGCSSDTLDKRARDASGIHCIKCGATVKDVFVEILVAVDSAKDPVFADGVRTGQLNAGSMGCNCARTQCNVCNHVAYTASEFCEHIGSGNKGTLWAKSARDGSWGRVEKRAAELALKKVGVKISPDFCHARIGDIDIRKAFERCQGVVFDEYSRVSQPADPKATQREVLKAASSPNIQTETDLLMLKTRIAALEGQVAMQNPNGHEADVHIEIPDESEVTTSTQGINIEYPNSEIPGLGEDELNLAPPMDIGDLQDAHLDLGETPADAEELGIAAPAPVRPPPVAPPIAPAMHQGAKNMFKQSYKDYKIEVTARGNARVLSPEGAVMLIRARQAKKTASKEDFGRDILTSIYAEGLVRTAKKFKALMSPRFAQITEDAISDMKDDTRSEPTHGTSAGGDCDMTDKSRCEKGYDGGKATEGGETDGPDHEDKFDSAIAGGDADHEKRTDAPKSMLEGESGDMSEKREPKNVRDDSALDDAINDRKTAASVSFVGKRVASKSWLNSDAETQRSESWLVTKRNAADKGADTYVLRQGSDICEVSADDLRDTWIALDKTALDTSKTEERLKKLHAARIAKVEAAQDGAIEAGVSKFIRALKLVASRQAVGLEDAPLKESLGIILANNRDVGQDIRTGSTITYEAMPADLAMHLIETAWDKGGEAHIDQLLSRAADLAGRSDEYLADAEADLSARQGSHRIATLTYQEQVSFEERRAAQIREDALSGNLQLNTSSSVAASVPQNGHSKSAAIRGALSATKAGLIKRQFQS